MDRELRTLVWRTLGYFVILEAMLVAAILFWPNFEENVGAIKKIVPAFMQEMVVPMIEGGVKAYVNAQHFFKGCNTLGVAAAVLFAMGAVAGEAHRGTLEIWLARPVSRTRLLTERWVSGALGVCLPVFATTATIPWLLGFVDESIPVPPLFWCAVHQSLFLLAVFSLTFLFSTVGRAPTKIAFGMLFFTTFQFAIYMVKVLTHWSIFRLTDIESFQWIFSRGGLDWTKAAPLVVMIGVCLTGSLVAFHRRVP